MTQHFQAPVKATYRPGYPGWYITLKIYRALFEVPWDLALLQKLWVECDIPDSWGPAVNLYIRLRRGWNRG
jgi:hypothetical protein